MSSRALVILVLAAAPLAAQQPQRPAAPRQPSAAQQRADSIAADSAIRAIEYRREVYNYQGSSRDPFRSLLTDEAVQTSINDLRLVSILYDPRGRSIVVVRDVNSARPHRLRRGDYVGRLRVIQIRPYEVVFQVDEFGFERQEVLTLQRPEVSR